MTLNGGWVLRISVLETPSVISAGCWEGTGLLEGGTGLWRGEISSPMKSISDDKAGHCWLFRMLSWLPTHLSTFLSLKHPHRLALPASAAILMALMNAKCTPKQKAALVDLKQKTDYWLILLLTAHFFLSIFCLKFLCRMIWLYVAISTSTYKGEEMFFFVMGWLRRAELQVKFICWANSLFNSAK